MDVEGCEASIYMMKFGAYIPLSSKPSPHDPHSFPRLKQWQLAAALEVVYRFVKEGKVLGPFPGTTRLCPITGHPLFFYPSFVVPKSKQGSYRWVLNASYNKQGPSVNDRIFDYSTKLISVKDSIYPMLRTRFMSRIDLTRAFKQLFRSISQLYLLATVVDNMVFIDAIMSFMDECLTAMVLTLNYKHRIILLATENMMYFEFREIENLEVFQHKN